jgi:uncharacterized protein YukE
MADPASMRATASRLQVEAGDLPSGLEALAAACGPDVWEGPAARRFLDDLAARRRRLSRASEEVRAVALRLHQRAAAEAPPGRPR